MIKIRPNLYEGIGIPISGVRRKAFNELNEQVYSGNIKIEDIPNFKNTSYIIDVSSALENEKGVKDINKIDKFLNSVHNN